jgi:hypothetical protein
MEGVREAIQDAAEPNQPPGSPGKERCARGDRQPARGSERGALMRKQLSPASSPLLLLLSHMHKKSIRYRTIFQPLPTLKAAPSPPQEPGPAFPTQEKNLHLLLLRGLLKGWLNTVEPVETAKEQEQTSTSPKYARFLKR